MGRDRTPSEDSTLGYVLGFSMALSVMMENDAHVLARGVLLASQKFHITTRRTVRLLEKLVSLGEEIAEMDTTDEEIHDVMDQMVRYQTEEDVAYR